MAQTLQDQLSLGCLRLGMVELKRTVKYRRFECPVTHFHYFIGRAGALRVSRTKKATMTAVVSVPYRNRILELGSNVVADPAKIGF